MTYTNPFGECFSLLFNLIISQLFIGAIGALIELIRMIAINVLSRYILKPEYIQNYGIYIQPIITSSLLTLIGLFVYYISKWTTHDGCDNSDFFRYFLYFVLVVIITILIILLFVYYYKITRKEKQLNETKYGYNIKH